MPVADSELVNDNFRYCVNINENLLGQRGINIATTDATITCIDTDVVQNSLLPRVSDQLGSTCLADLILSPAEIQMNNWKPDATKIMQQFQDYDNEGFGVSKILFAVVQNSKLCFMTCREVLLFGLKYTDSPSAANWAI